MKDNPKTEDGRVVKIIARYPKFEPFTAHIEEHFLQEEFSQRWKLLQNKDTPSCQEVVDNDSININTE